MSALERALRELLAAVLILIATMAIVNKNWWLYAAIMIPVVAIQIRRLLKN